MLKSIPHLTLHRQFTPRTDSTHELLLGTSLQFRPVFSLDQGLNKMAIMETEALKQYLADSPPTVVVLPIKPHFEALTDREKRYAHHLSR